MTKKFYKPLNFDIVFRCIDFFRTGNPNRSLPWNHPSTQSKCCSDLLISTNYWRIPYIGLPSVIRHSLHTGKKYLEVRKMQRSTTVFFIQVNYLTWNCFPQHNIQTFLPQLMCIYIMYNPEYFPCDISSNINYFSFPNMYGASKNHKPIKGDRGGKSRKPELVPVILNPHQDDV